MADQSLANVSVQLWNNNDDPCQKKVQRLRLWKMLVQEYLKK